MHLFCYQLDLNFIALEICSLAEHNYAARLADKNCDIYVNESLNIVKVYIIVAYDNTCSCVYKQ